MMLGMTRMSFSKVLLRLRICGTAPLRKTFPVSKFLFPPVGKLVYVLRTILLFRRALLMLITQKFKHTVSRFYSCLYNFNLHKYVGTSII